MQKRENRTFKVRVYYEDVDLGGIVYHSKYLNFCERARSEIFFSQQKSPVADEYHFVVKHIDANFLASGKFEDLLEVHTEMVQKKRASLTLHQSVYDTSDQEKLFEMSLQLVCMRVDRIAPIPAGMLDVFA